MSTQKTEQLQTELMRAGLQLLHNAGHKIDTNEAAKIVARWARDEAPPLARRLRL